MLKKVGFLGLGTVGKHMAINLLKGNYELIVYDSDKLSLWHTMPREYVHYQDILLLIPDITLLHYHTGLLSVHPRLF